MKHRSLLFFLPALVALAVRFPALTGSLVHDDAALLGKHPRLDEANFGSEIFLRDYGREFVSRDVGYYRPLVVLLAFLLRRTFGHGPFPFHAASLLVFCFASSLLAWTGWRTGGRRERGLWTAVGCLYAAHPARAEVVSLFTSLPDLLVETFALLLLCLSAPGEGATAAGGARFRPSLAFRGFLCGCLGLAAGLAKESAFLVMPALGAAAIALGLALGGKAPEPLVAGFSVFAGLAAAFAPRLLLGLPRDPPAPGVLVAALREGSGRALDSLAWALRELAIPGHPVVWRSSASQGSGPACACLAVFFAACAALWLATLCSRRPALSLFAAWLAAGSAALALPAIVALPYSQRFVPVAPALALLAAAAGAAAAALRRGRLVAAPAVALYVAAHGAFSFGGSVSMATPAGFYGLIERTAPAEIQPLVALAVLKAPGGTAGQLERWARRATALDPAHPLVRQLQGMTAKRYLDEGRYADALRWLDRALRADPADPDKHALRAAALAYLGRLGEADAAIGRALAADPGNAAYLRLGGQIARDRAAAAPVAPPPAD